MTVSFFFNEQSFEGVTAVNIVSLVFGSNSRYSSCDVSFLSFQLFVLQSLFLSVAFLSRPQKETSVFLLVTPQVFYEKVFPFIFMVLIGVKCIARNECPPIFAILMLFDRGQQNLDKEDPMSL